jgi:hypothetical protein
LEELERRTAVEVFIPISDEQKAKDNKLRDLVDARERAKYINHSFFSFRYFTFCSNS